MYNYAISSEAGTVEDLELEDVCKPGAGEFHPIIMT